jgi:ribonucleoside-diphosphate reductase alpha chain
LPPNGACLLGSFNLTKYIISENNGYDREIPQNEYVKWAFDYEQFAKDIPPIVRMMDNVIDNTIYPLPEQELEAKAKRRMGIGITGLANTAEVLGLPYGSPEMIDFMKRVMTILRDKAYATSVDMAITKGAFPQFNSNLYPEGSFIATLPREIKENISRYGIRNSHLLSIAPTGTISLFAGNISSGIEPPFALEYERRTIMPDGTIQWWPIYDYAFDQYGVAGLTSGELSAEAHINVLVEASKLVDSACSKTCNVGEQVTFEEFKNLYIMAYNGGASGCTTYRPAAIETRGAVMREAPVAEESMVCTFDPVTGERSCAD